MSTDSIDTPPAIRPARKPRTASTAKPARKSRIRQPHYYRVVIGGNEPVIVIAKTQRAALEAIITITPADPSDLIEAGKAGRTVIDTAKDGAVSGIPVSVTASISVT